MNQVASAILLLSAVSSISGGCVGSSTVLGPDCTERGNCPGQGTGGTAGASGSGGVSGSGVSSGGAAAGGAGGSGGCGALLGDCNGNASDGCETDLDSTPQHCSACGYDCGGGACADSLCGAWTVASGGAEPRFIVTYGGDVYFTASASGEVRKAPKLGGNETVLASGQVNPWRLAVGAGHVCWCDVSSTSFDVWCVSTGGGSPIPVASDVPNSELFGFGPYIAIHEPSATAYFTAADASTGGAVWMAPVSAPGAAQVIPGTAANPLGIVADASHVYWAMRGTQENGYEDGAVVRAEPDGSNASPIAADQSSPNDLWVVGSTVYFRTVDFPPGIGGILWRVPTSGGAAPELYVDTATLDPFFVEWAVDGVAMYWTSGSAVRKWDGATAILLATESDVPYGIAIDDTYVYWAASAGTSVRAIHK